MNNRFIFLEEELLIYQDNHQRRKAKDDLPFHKSHLYNPSFASNIQSNTYAHHFATNSKKLTEKDWVDAASSLCCEVEAIKAVAEIESGKQSGFLKDGITPKILFEGHVFHRLTNGRYTNAVNHDISYAKWTRKYYNMDQHKRLQKAVTLDRNAALKSASWGKFQIMGFNHKIVGHNTLQSFINAMYKNEKEQLKAFIAFVKYKKIDDELRNKNWAGFAKVYNGAGYAKNHYDTKMKKAYNSYKNKK